MLTQNIKKNYLIIILKIIIYKIVNVLRKYITNIVIIMKNLIFYVNLKNILSID